MIATGVAIGSEPEPYRLDYLLRCDARYLTREVRVASEGDGWARTVELRRREDAWLVEVEQHGTARLADAGGDATSLTDAMDADLGLSPLFNTMPVLRHRLHVEPGSEDFVMVWISVPDLALHRSRQRYVHVATSGREHVVRFRSLDEDVPFTSDLVFDADGIVVDYPGLATRIGP